MELLANLPNLQFRGSIVFLTLVRKQFVFCLGGRHFLVRRLLYITDMNACNKSCQHLFTRRAETELHVGFSPKLTFNSPLHTLRKSATFYQEIQNLRNAKTFYNKRNLSLILLWHAWTWRLFLLSIWLRWTERGSLTPNSRVPRSFFYFFNLFFFILLFFVYKEAPRCKRLTKKSSLTQ